MLALISFHTGPDVSCVSVQMTLVSNIESYRDYHNIGYNLRKVIKRHEKVKKATE